MSKARPPSKNQLLQIPSKVTGSKAVTPLSSHTWRRSWVTGASEDNQLDGYQAGSLARLGLCPLEFSKDFKAGGRLGQPAGSPLQCQLKEARSAIPTSRPIPFIAEGTNGSPQTRSVSHII